MTVFDIIPRDAVAPNPKTGELVWLLGNRYDRAPLETAWLFLQEANGDRVEAGKALRAAGWDMTVCTDYVRAAERWTGNVVPGSARDRPRRRRTARPHPVRRPNRSPRPQRRMAPGGCPQQHRDVVTMIR